MLSYLNLICANVRGSFCTTEKQFNVYYTMINFYEFDFGSEWTRAEPLDTCEFY